MSEFTIRPALPAEVPAVGRLTVDAYRASGHLSDGDTYEAKLADAAGRFQKAELLVAVDADGAVLGTVTLAPPGSQWRNIAAEGELEFRMLAVSTAARGRGIGEALARAVLDRASELGVRAVVMSSDEDMTTAHRLYERLGFYRTPARDWQPDGGTTLLTYRLDL